MKFSRKLFTAIFLVLISFLCCCSNIFQKEDEALGYVRINIGSAGLSRTLLPVIDNNDIEEIHLLSRRSVDVEYEEVGSWESVSDIPELSFATGPWWFKLVVHTEQCSFSDTSHIEITSGEHLNLSFSLTSNLDKGGMYLKLNLTGNAAAADFTFTEYSTENEVDSGALDIKGTTSAHYVEYARRIQYPSEALNEGNYYITVTLYGDTDRQLLLNTYEEVVQIKNGFTSKGERTIELNGIYSIEYDKNGGSEAAGVSLKTLFTERSADYILPSLTKTGYTFAGWYESADFSGSPVTVLSQGTNTDKHYYAKWNAINYTITYNVDDGTFTAGYTKPESYTIESSSIILPNSANITKNGYVFEGWYTDSTFSETSVTTIDTGTIGNKIYYAKWIPGGYTITYVTNGGTWQTDYTAPSAYNIESASITLPMSTNISKNGYIFNGWYPSSTFSDSSITSIETGTTGDKTYYAKWTPVEYDITFNENSGTFSSTYTKPAKYTIESSDITLPTSSNITRSGYIFEGWYTTNSDDDVNKITTIPTGSIGNKTFYAKWSTVGYAINYELDGGSNPAGTVNSYNITDTPVTLPTPTKTGYTFDGWYTDSGFTSSKQTTIPSDSTGAKTYYAKWTINTYTITYVTNEGTFAGDYTKPENYTVASPVTLPTSTNITKTGYTFKGWYESSTFSGSAVTATSSTTTGNKTYYAKWEVNTYTITYVTNSGTYSSGYTAPANYTVASPATLPTSTNITKTGYTFNGWYESSTFSGSAVSATSSTTTGNKTYYAKWIVNTYTITYVTNSGTYSSGYTAPANYTVASPATLPTSINITKTGYTFKGWYENSSLSGTAVTATSSTTTGNKTYYAKWEAITYTITYTVNGGAWNSGSTAHATYKITSSNLTLGTLSKDGYTFGGWFEDEDCLGTRVTVIETGTTGDKHFYAKWTPVTYSLTLNANGGTWKSGYTSPSSYTVGSPVTLPTGTYITKTGYELDGWYTSATTTGLTPMTTTDGLTGHRTLYAGWSPAEYTITFNTNGGSFKSGYTKPATYTYTETLTLPTAANIYKNLWIFKGWYEDSSFEGDPVTKIVAETSTGAKTYYAKWIGESVSASTVSDAISKIESAEEGQTVKILASLTTDDIIEINTKLKNRTTAISLDLTFANIEELPSNAFFGNTKIKDITLPNSLKKIGASAFLNMGSEYTTITIPASVEEIGSRAMDGKFTSFYVASGNTHFYAQDGILYENHSTYGVVLRQYPQGKEDTSYTIEPEVNRISESAFSGKSNLTSITIGAGVNYIEHAAFNVNPYLTNVVITKNSTGLTIDTQIFSQCTNTNFTMIEYTGTTSQWNELVQFTLGANTANNVQHWLHKTKVATIRCSNGIISPTSHQ